jgi:hypothetical protein
MRPSLGTAKERMLVEIDIFGTAALNVIACEGTDSVERPETYKQWQVRNHRSSRPEAAATEPTSCQGGAGQGQGQLPQRLRRR